MFAAARTGEVMGEFGRLYEQQYAVALFNNIRLDIEGGGGPQPQLLHRKIPVENKSIFSGSLLQYLEENKKWRNHFLFVPDSYNISYYDNKAAHDRRLHPKGTINCAGYRVLTSMEQYLDVLSSSLPGVKAKVGSSPFLKCASQFPLILWHPYSRHYYFCATTEKEQQKWHAVLQDCVRHTNDGLSEEDKVQTPAFTDAVRLYRQAKGHYGTWEMMCGAPSQILSNLVMDDLLPELRELISPRLKGKLHERQRNWMLISDAVYSLVQGQCQTQYEALLQKCEAARSSLDATIRTDMDQIITSKEHVTNKIRAHGEDLPLAFHPVKMHSCYEKVEQLSLEGLQQRFDVSSPSVFTQRAQILMREQMDDAVYTFEQILHQSLESQGREDLCKTIQRCQDRVIKKFDYDSSTVRKRFFREALLQIFIPYMLKQLSPACASELPRFQELIFEDFSRFILVENIFEEVVLHSAMKDIMMAVKEAAVQRRHNLYRDSIVLSNSDPSLHLLGENPSIDWAKEHSGGKEEVDGAGDDTEDDVDGEDGESQKKRRMKQVVSMIQVEDSVDLSAEPSTEVPCNDDITERDEEEEEKEGDEGESSSPESLKASESSPGLSNGSVVKEEEARCEEQVQEILPKVESATESTVASEEKEKEKEKKEKEKEEEKEQQEEKEEEKEKKKEKEEEKGDNQSVLEEQPPSIQEVSEKVLPPAPETTETSSENPPEGEKGRGTKCELGFIGQRDGGDEGMISTDYPPPSPPPLLPPPPPPPPGPPVVS
ncbi:hypothetical protein INR49_028066, partial [Caranx melampygus]